MEHNLSPQHLLWEGSYNVRDLGGYPTVAGSVIRDRSLVRADNLGHLTTTGQQALIAYGIRTIIDVRSAYEATTWPHAFTQHHMVTYLNVPIGEVNDAALEAQMKTATLVQWNCLALDHGRQQIAMILRQIAQAEPAGILIHCHAGKDRTGLVVALVLALVGVEPTLIALDYAASDRYLQPLYAKWLESVAHDPIQHAKLAEVLTTSPETMRAILAYVGANYGGVTAYTKHCGNTDNEIQIIKDRLCLDTKVR